MRAGLLRLLLWLAITGCSLEQGAIREPAPTRIEVWEAILPRAERYRMEPAFVYALVAAESGFDPAARNGECRGLLQLRPEAWATVSVFPYEPAVWDWRTNLEAGIDYLAYCRSSLHRRPDVEFSYPLLLAAFHYGLDNVEACGFDVRRLRCPEHPIYRELWQGNLAPLESPGH